MRERKVQDFCESFVAIKKWPRSKEEIEELWEPVAEELNTNEQTYLLWCLVEKDNVFKWLRLISHLLPNLVSEDQIFVNLLDEIVSKVRGDMAQGDFVRSLINIGEKYPKKGIALFHLLAKTSSDLTIHYSGLVLGGAAKKSFAGVFEIIKEVLKKEKPPTTVACLRALRIAFEDAKNLELSNDIFQILERSLEVEDLSVRREVVHAYLDFDKFRPEICEKRLLEIAQKGDSLMRFTIVDRLWFLDLKDRSNEVAILKICSRDDDLNVLGGIARILSRKGEVFINDSLEILYGWLKRSKYHDIPALDYSLHELGKNTLPHCLKIVERWIEFEDEPRFLLQVSRLLRNLASSNYDELLNKFEEWIVNKGLKFKKVIIETLVDILMFGNPSENIIDRSFNIMKMLKERELQSTLESNLVQLFGKRPPFVKSEKIIQILDEWVSSPDWTLRKNIIPALLVVAEYKVDSEETLHMLINKETKETKVAGISSKMIETPEGVKAYELLEGLTNDEKDEVKKLAVRALKDVNRRLEIKEKRIAERVQ